jgi:hypothetical protein
MPHLMRTWYQTDYSPGDGIGTFSSTIPESAFRDGSTIVGVDWSTPGEVEVTFLIPGPHDTPREQVQP